jgi:predicted acetyltransferase
MGLEIRPAKAEEMEEFHRVVKTAFVSPPEHTLKMPIEWTLCAFVDGKLATSYAVWPLTMQFINVSVPVAGVTMVGTLPIYRRRGYLRRITEAHFNLLHERGDSPIAALFASMAAIYQRYGYAVVSTRHAYTVEPGALKFAHTLPITGDFQELDETKHSLLLDLYHRFVVQKVGYLHRSGALEVAPGAPFTSLTFPPSSGLVTIIVYREAGEPLGYVIYSVEHDERPGRAMGQRLIIRDLVWLTASAYRAIWGWCEKSIGVEYPLMTLCRTCCLSRGCSI